MLWQYETDIMPWVVQNPVLPHLGGAGWDQPDVQVGPSGARTNFIFSGRSGCPLGGTFRWEFLSQSSCEGRLMAQGARVVAIVCGQQLFL